MPAPYSGEPAFSFFEAVDLPVRFIRRVIMGVIMRRSPMEAQDSLSGTPGRIVGTGGSHGRAECDRMRACILRRGGLV